jgi:hypothetical protein
MENGNTIQSVRRWMRKHLVSSVPANLVAFKILGLRQQLMVMDRMTALDF